MSRSKKLLALALAKDSPSFHANEELLKLQNNTIHQKIANNSNKNFRNVNTDVFSSKDLPLQFPYQNTKNEYKIENSSSSVFDDSDADQTYNPFYIKQKTIEVCSNNSPDCIEASIDSFVFRTNKFCCKKNCFNLCPEDIQKLIFEEFYGLGNLGAQDQTLMDGIQIEEKKRATTFIGKSASRTT
ncbi:hypothetical protein AGLY_016634 [Aphis glycines]|uniref:Uncharacterized protein n=1 Tax=Aphis glycines TaxID=307491 RepID=A0A6G0SXA4_APHGL|nr:hypothetical protein AGLY_016634 [Aphis glycines]